MSFICLLFVIPAEAEIYVFVSFLDSRFRGNDIFTFSRLMGRIEFSWIAGGQPAMGNSLRNRVS
jgi:hypothetical protein